MCGPDAREPFLMEGNMTYEKPTMERFGSLRELTLVGLGADGDGGIGGSGFLDGCNISGCDSRS